MKRILSILLSVVLTLSLFSVVGFAAETNVSSADLELFENYLTDNNLSFDENYYFFISDFGTANDYGYEGNFLFEIKADKEVSLEIGIGLVDNGRAWLMDSFNPAIGVDSYNAKKYTVTNKPVQIASVTKFFNVFLPTNVGFALQNPSVLTDNTTVTVALYKAEINMTTAEVTKGDLLAEKTHTFNAPITFENKKYAKIGVVLTKLSMNKDISYYEVVAALNDMADATDVSDIDKAKLDENLTETTVAKLANIITENNADVTVAGKTNGVSIPYAALAQAVDGAVEYAPIVANADENYTVSGIDANAKQKAINIKLGANGNEVKPVVKQKVIVDVPSTFDLTQDVKVYHEQVEIPEVTVDSDSRTVSFWVDSFSNFLLVGSAAAENDNTRAEMVQFEIVQDADEENKFSLVIAPYTDEQQIIRFATAAMEYQFKVDGITEGAIKNFTYELDAADGIKITNLEDVNFNDDSIVGAFKFVATSTDGKNLITAGVGESIKIADLTITGNGKFKVQAQSAEYDDANIYTETVVNNEIMTGKVVQWTSDVIDIPVDTKTLTINVDFGLNRIETTDADYLGMSVALVGDISNEEKVLKIGEDIAVTLDDVNKTATATGTIELPAKENYEFVIKGLGYRTFRGSVYLDENKTINLWNNAIDDGTTVNVVADDNATAKTVTFLVGDIYMDGIVDIYDLSAATSYYGAENIDKANTNVYACDLNRDGKITIADIAYVQVSYGN